MADYEDGAAGVITSTVNIEPRTDTALSTLAHKEKVKNRLRSSE
jgi:hypothetical protein